MTFTPQHVLLTIMLIGFATTANAEYKATVDPNGPITNVGSDFGLVDDNAKSNQSELLQKAIDKVASAGGGRLLIPKGTYSFSGISMKSDVHLLIEAGTVIKPWWPANTKVCVFGLIGESDDPDGHIENVSIRGINGEFIIDCSEHGAVPGEGVRSVMCKRVKNFLLSDFSIKDNFTTYCAVVFTPMKHKHAREWDVFRPTDGLVKNIESTDSSPGYGLVQMHAGERIHFENLSAIGGGITFRLETGAGGLFGGVFDITAKNIYCENGSKAVLLGPHTSQNGVVTIDGVLAKSCSVAVSCGAGFIEKKNLDDPNYKQGKFGEGTTIENVHAVFGTNAAISIKGLANYPKAYLNDLRVDENDPQQKRVRGPSSGVVIDSTGDNWSPIIKNVTSEGFKYNKGILKPDGKKKHGKSLIEDLPLYQQIEDQKAEYRERKDAVPVRSKNKSRK